MIEKLNYKKAKYKKKNILLIILAVVFFALMFSGAGTDAAKTDNGNDSDPEKELSEGIGMIIEGLDLAELEAYFASLSQEEQELFGSGNVLERIQKIVSGEMQLDYGNFFSYIMQAAGINFMKYIPFIITIIGISIAFSMISSIKGRFASDSVEKIIHFANIAIIIILVLTQLTMLITAALKLITSLQKQMNIFFPVILTLMVSIGAGGSAAVYQPAVAILAAGVTEVIMLIVLPCLILSNVFTIIGSISDGVKLKKMAGFFSSVSKWMLGTMFFLFMAFLSIQGVTASVYDGVSIRTAKFALSKYVPIIGGYLSEGLNLFLAGSVLIKNAVGMTAVIMLIVSIIPTIVQAIIFNLSLHLTGAIIEPLGNSKMSEMLTGVAKNMSMLVAVLLAIAFMYFIFLILIVSTGNLVI